MNIKILIFKNYALKNILIILFLLAYMLIEDRYQYLKEDEGSQVL